MIQTRFRRYWSRVPFLRPNPRPVVPAVGPDAPADAPALTVVLSKLADDVDWLVDQTKEVYDKAAVQLSNVLTMRNAIVAVAPDELPPLPASVVGKSKSRREWNVATTITVMHHRFDTNWTNVSVARRQIKAVQRDMKTHRRSETDAGSCTLAEYAHFRTRIAVSAKRLQKFSAINKRNIEKYEKLFPLYRQVVEKLGITIDFPDDDSSAG